MNPLQLNDWPIRKFILSILVVNLAMLGSVGLDYISFQFSIIRQIIAFVYLAFMPGIIILRILKLHQLGNVETFLYATGLSIATLMFVGLGMNVLYPFLGVDNPMSIEYLMTTISALMLILCMICYKVDGDYSSPKIYLDINNLYNPPVLFLCLIPILTILGTYFVNFHHNNIILIAIIVIISSIIVLVGCDVFVSNKLYPFVIFIIAISLLYHTSLISMYIWGWDIHLEYYLANQVIANSLWNFTISSSVNGMLSVVMLAPIFAITANMNLAWVFKIIYPFFFSLVPVGLYRLFQKQTNDKIAFLSVIFFVSIFTFYTEMLSVVRQQISELFLVLLLLLLFNQRIDKFARSLLLIIFAFSLIVSHYGLSYITMASFILLCLFALIRSHYRHEELNGVVSNTFVFIYIVFTITWYINVSNSMAFSNFVHVVNNIVTTFSSDFLNQNSAQGLDIILSETISPMRTVTKYLHIITIFFISLGSLFIFLNPNKINFNKDFIVLIEINYILCIAGIVVPYLASSLNTTRLYHITLIYLAPMCVIGGMIFFNAIGKFIRLKWLKDSETSLKFLSLLFAVFLLFNSGLVYEVVNESPSSISLSQKSIEKNGNQIAKVNFYNMYIPEQDVFSAKWLSDNKHPIYSIYSDSSLTGLKNNVLLSVGNIYPTEIFTIAINNYHVADNSYIFMRYLNVVEGLMSSLKMDGTLKKSDTYNTTDIIYLIEMENKIYSNGASYIFIS